MSLLSERAVSVHAYSRRSTPADARYRSLAPLVRLYARFLFFTAPLFQVDALWRAALPLCACGPGFDAFRGLADFLAVARPEEHPWRSRARVALHAFLSRALSHVAQQEPDGRAWDVLSLAHPLSRAEAAMLLDLGARENRGTLLGVLSPQVGDTTGELLSRAVLRHEGKPAMVFLQESHLLREDWAHELRPDVDRLLGALGTPFDAAYLTYRQRADRFLALWRAADPEGKGLTTQAFLDAASSDAIAELCRVLGFPPGHKPSAAAVELALDDLARSEDATEFDETLESDTGAGGVTRWTLEPSVHDRPAPPDALDPKAVIAAQIRAFRRVWEAVNPSGSALSAEDFSRVTQETLGHLPESGALVDDLMRVFSLPDRNAPLPRSEEIRAAFERFARDADVPDARFAPVGRDAWIFRAPDRSLGPQGSPSPSSFDRKVHLDAIAVRIFAEHVQIKPEVSLSGPGSDSIYHVIAADLYDWIRGAKFAPGRSLDAYRTILGLIVYDRARAHDSTLPPWDRAEGPEREGAIALGLAGAETAFALLGLAS
jgi:hypothetical protein